MGIDHESAGWSQAVDELSLSHHDVLKKWKWFVHVVNPIWLVVWNMAFMTFPSIGNVIIPTDEPIFFRGVGIPYTTNQQ